MTLTIKYHVDSGKMQAKYVGQKSSSRTSYCLDKSYCPDTQTDIHTRPIAIPGPLKWSVTYRPNVNYRTSRQQSSQMNLYARFLRPDLNGLLFVLYYCHYLWVETMHHVFIMYEYIIVHNLHQNAPYYVTCSTRINGYSFSVPPGTSICRTVLLIQTISAYCTVSEKSEWQIAV